MTESTQKANIRLSVIIPCFNHGGYIMDAIKSVEACQSQIYEIIIVNDGSTDTLTCDVMRQLEQDGYQVINQVNQGLGAARNTGIGMAKGEYILPLDSDNKIRPDYIYKSIEILDRYPKIGVVYGNAEYFGEKTGLWEVPDFDLPLLVLRNYIDACAVFRKSTWESCGYYDTKMPMCGYEDWDFWLSIAQKGWEFHHIPEVLFDYRVRSGSMITICIKSDNQKRLVDYIYNKHIDLVKLELNLLYDELTAIRGHYLYKLYHQLRNSQLAKVWRTLKWQLKVFHKFPKIQSE